MEYNVYFRHLCQFDSNNESLSLVIFYLLPELSLGNY